MAFSGRTPAASERRWLDAITRLGCIACLLDLYVWSEPSPHHTVGKTKPGAHYLTIPLCWRHHQAGDDCAEYTSRHPHKARFEARYGAEAELIQATLDRIGGSLDEQARRFFIDQGFVLEVAA